MFSLNRLHLLWEGGGAPAALPLLTHQNRQMLAIRKSRLPQVQPSAHMCFRRMFSRKKKKSGGGWWKEEGLGIQPAAVPLILS